MLNILKGAKVAQDSDTGDIYLIDCCDGPKNLSAGGSGGGGFEYDFIIKSTDGETFTLETGTYESINAKLGNQPLNGKIIVNDGHGYLVDMNCVLVVNNGEVLGVDAWMGDSHVSLIINADNTVTL